MNTPKGISRNKSLWLMMSFILASLAVNILPGSKLFISDIILIGFQFLILSLVLSANEPISKGIVYIFLITMLVCTINVINAVDYSKYIVDAIQLMVYVPGVYIISDYLVRRYGLGSLENAYINACVLMTLLAIIQYAVLVVYKINIFAWYTRFSGESGWIENFYRVSGMYRHYNHMAFALLPAVVFALKHNRFYSYLLLSIGVFITGSRVGIASLLFVTLTISYIYLGFFNKLKIYSVATIGVISVVLIFSDMIAKRFSLITDGSIDKSTNLRIEYLNQGLELIEKFPVFGIGMGQLPYYVYRDSLESGYFQILIELGFVVFVIFNLFMIYVIGKAIYNKMPEYSILIFLLLISLVVQPFLAIAVTGPIFWFVVFISLSASSHHYVSSERSGFLIEKLR